MEKFNLNEQLAKDTIFIKDLKLSKLLLMNNKEYPWFILVPRIAEVSEIYELNEKSQKILIKEISEISKLLKDLYEPDKINVANLGNKVRQLHIHIIARFKKDLLWPDPIWGRVQDNPYSEDSISEFVNLVKDKL